MIIIFESNTDGTATMAEKKKPDPLMTSGTVLPAVIAILTKRRVEAVMT
jgi:hypothetical protein